jgi:hypothetical protein
VPVRTRAVQALGRQETPTRVRREPQGAWRKLRAAAAARPLLNAAVTATKDHSFPKRTDFEAGTSQPSSS